MANLYDQFDAQSEVKDLATSFGVGSNQLLKMAGDVYGLATGNMDNVVSRQGQENIDYLQRGKSQKLIDSETRRKAAVDMEEGTLNQALAYVRETFTDPRLFLSTTAEAAPSLVGAGGIGAGARVATGKVLAKVGAEKAAETAAKVGVGTAVAAGVGMQGTSVGADQYKEIVELLSNMPEDQALKVPQIVQLVVEKGATLEEAKTALALDLARSTGALSALASAATQMLPGGRIIEKAIVGGAGKKIAGAALTRAGVGAIGEGLQEALEGGSGAGVKNLLARAVDPERKITEGMGEAMGAGFAGAGPIGAAAGAASRPSRPVLASETTAGKSSEPLASDAIPQETRTSTTDTPDLSLEGAGEMNTREVGSVLSARESAARGFTPDPSDIATAESVRRPQIEVSEEAAKAANAPVQEALDEWRTQNPDVGVNITVINDPNMRNTRNYGIRGYFDPNTGEVVINSAFTKPFEVESVVNHEWSHHTLSSEEGRAALVEFATRDIPQEELDALAKRYPNADNLTLVEEWIARSQETSPGTFARIIAKIREWLNGKLGINMSNEEVARVMLRTLRERGAPVAEGSGEMRQSTTEQSLANDATSRSSGIMASPSITDIDYSRAKQNLTSSAQARFRSQVKDYAPDAVIYNAVGDWKDGAENSVAAIFDTAMPTADLEQLAAKAGLAGDQKAVLWWTTDPNGADAIHRVTWPKEVTMDQARQAMIDAGLENRTLIETPDGVQGFVFDQGQQNLNKISNLHENSTEPSINTQRATGDFLGSSWDNTKSPRAEAKRAYRAVLGRAEETQTGDRGGQYDQWTGGQPEVEPERSSVLAKQPIRESVTEEPISEESGSKPSDALKLLSADDRESIVEAAQFLARNAGDDALANRLNSVKDVLRLQGEAGLAKAGDAAGIVLQTVIDSAKAPAQKLTNATETDIANRLGRNRTDAGEKLDARDVQKRSKKLEHTVPDEVIDLVHYSSNGNLATVDPASLGKGVATRNDRRGLLKSFYFVRGSPLSGDRNLVSGAGKTVYEAKVASDRIYDANTDALGYWEIINRYDADQMLVKQNYAGFGVTGDDGRQTVTMYEPLAVNNTGQSGDEMRAGEGRGMRSKKPIRESLTDDPVGQTKKQTESPEFKKWFEVSKVVNEDGTPKVMFHSTTAGDVLTAFKRNPKDVGFHFGTAGQAEDRFNLKLEKDPYGPNLRGVSHATIPVFLRINRPLRMPDLGSWSGDNIYFALKNDPEFKGKLYQDSTSAEARDAIKAAGYDGIVYANTGESEGASVYRKARDEAWADYQSSDWYRAQQAKRRPSDRFPSEEMKALPEYQAYQKASEAERAFRESNPQDSYIAFDPNQVKSATGNTGAFDPKKKDIRYSVTEEPVGQTKKQTESPEFKNWFGDWQDPKAFTSRAKGPVSQVFKDGKPLVVYHATTKDFDAFESGRPTFDDMGFFGNVETNRHAIFFSDVPEQAASYVTDSEGRADTGARTIPAYLDMKSPLYLDRNTRLDDLAEETGVNYNWLQNRRTWWELLDGEDGKMFVEGLKKAGYDGIVFEEDPIRPGVEVGNTYAVFEPSQVKSATGNRGTFDPTNPDIRFSVTDKPVGETALEDAKTLTFKNQIEVSKYLGDLLKKEFPNGLDGRSPEDRANLADMFDRELSLALTIPENADAIGWYNREMQKVFEVLRSPELDFKLDDPTNRGIFNAILAVTSNGQKVVPQFLKTAQLYGKWLKTGKIPPVGKWGGERNSAIKGHLKFLNQLIEAVGPEQTVGFLTSEQSLGDHLTNLYGMVAEAQNLPAEASVADQKAAVKKYLKTTMPSGELVDYNTVGAAVLGPKLGGGFFANLYGKFDRLTMDRWFMRTFHRLTGRLGLQRTDTIAGVLQEARSEAADVLPEDVSDEEILQEINTTGKQASKNYKSIQNRLKENPDDTEALSQDLMRRLYNRYTKARSGLFDAPDNGGHRNFIRDVVNDVQKRRAERGEEHIDTSDIQAILWYLEKDIWNQLRKKTEVDEVEDADAQADEEDGDTEDTAGRVSYSDGARELYRQKTGREFQFQNESAKNQILRRK